MSHVKVERRFAALPPQVQQKFFKYPQPEYPFNYVDNLISGDYTALTEATKYRRLLFNIVPPKVKYVPGRKNEALRDTHASGIIVSRCVP